MSDLVLGHLALALARHRKAMAVNRVPVPPEVVTISDLLLECARVRQDPTPLGPDADSLDAEAMNTPLMTKREAATALRMSPRTVERLIAGGSLPAVKVEGSTRIRRVDLEAYVAGLLGSASFHDVVEAKDGAA